MAVTLPAVCFVKAELRDLQRTKVVSIADIECLNRKFAARRNFDFPQIFFAFCDDRSERSVLRRVGVKMVWLVIRQILNVIRHAELLPRFSA